MGYTRSVGIGEALMPRGGIFSGLGGDVQKAAFKKARMKTGAQAAAAAKTKCAQQAAQVLGLSFDQFMKALSDPAVASWFNTFCAAVAAGQTPPAPPAAVLEAAHAAAGAPSGGGPAGAGGVPTIAKVGIAAGAVVTAVAIGRALFGKKKAAA